MATVNITKTFDSALELKDAYALTASAAAQVDSSNKIVDLGAGTVRGDIVVDVSACEVASDDEKYVISVQISDSSTFSSGYYEVARLVLGSAGTAAGDNLAGDVDMADGRWIIPFVNNIADGVAKRYMRLYTIISGTISTGINYSAYLTR